MPQHYSLPQPPQRILVINLRYLGDVLLMTPLLSALRRAYPEARIEVLVYRHCAEMLEGNPDIDRVLTTPPRPRAADYVALARQIVRRYDLAFALQSGDRRLLYALLAAPIRVGFVPDRGEKSAWKRRYFQAWTTHAAHRHIVQEMLALGELIGVAPYWSLTPPRALHNSTWPDLPECYAVLHPYPQWRYKRWPLAHWLEVARYLISLGITPVFSGGPAVEEQAYLDAIMQSLRGQALNIAGKVRLAQLTYILGDSVLFIGPDTGITHLAAASGAKVIALYGPTDPTRWGPWPIGYQQSINPYLTRGHQSINNVYLLQGPGSCVPCQQEGCDRHRDSSSQCLDDLPVAAVKQAIQQMLTARAVNAASRPASKERRLSDVAPIWSSVASSCHATF